MLKKVLEVFTREYREETEYREYMERILDVFKLNNQSEDIEKKVNRLIDKNFVSHFSIEIGEFK